MSNLSKSKITAYGKQLKSKLKDLIEVHEATVKDRAPVILDQTSTGRLSRIDAMQVQAMSVETDRRREIEIKRIEAALGRLDEGELGYCVSCGEEIETKRLENDPSSPTCIVCASGKVR